MPHPPVRPSSLWWDGDRSHDGAPELEGRVRADVAVIGAGIVGVTAAADLATAGKDVVLLEAGRVGSGATGHTTAKATALQSPRYATLAKEHGADAATAYARLSLEAVDRIRADAARFDTGRSEEAPALTWTPDEDRVDTLRAEGVAARDAGLPVTDVHDHPRFPLRHGLRLEDQFRFEPLLHLRGLLAQGLAAGLRVFESTPVTGVSLTGSTRTVTARRGAVVAEHVVVATGLPILDRGGWFARMEPRTSYVVAMRSTELPDEMGLRVGGSTRSSRRALDPDGDPVLLVAGAGHAVGEGGDTRRHPADLAAWGRLRFDAQEEVARWSAQDWSPADDLPLAGPLVPGDDRVLAAGGFDKWGLTSGTAAAATLQRRILGESLTDVDRVLDPARLPHARGARRLAKINASVGWSMTSGWLRALRPLRPLARMQDGNGAPAEGEGRVGRDGTTPVAESTVHGEQHRCRAVCPHLGGIVQWDPEGHTWACPLHGSRFDHDGRVLSGPASRGLASVDREG